MSKARDLANAGTALTTVSATELGYLDGVTSAVQTQLNAQIPKSTVTTKGDILAATGSGTIVRQGIGSNGQVLTADSAEADGLKWATPAGVTGVSAMALGSATTSGGGYVSVTWPSGRFATTPFVTATSTGVFWIYVSSPSSTSAGFVSYNQNGSQVGPATFHYHAAVE
jgi:hypothetical protein